MAHSHPWSVLGCASSSKRTASSSRPSALALSLRARPALPRRGAAPAPRPQLLSRDAAAAAAFPERPDGGSSGAAGARWRQQSVRDQIRELRARVVSQQALRNDFRELRARVLTLEERLAALEDPVSSTF